MESMLAEYLPILIFFAIAGAMAVAIVGASYVIAPQRPDAEKLSAYECGFDAFGDARRHHLRDGHCRWAGEARSGASPL